MSDLTSVSADHAVGGSSGLNQAAAADTSSCFDNDVTIDSATGTFVYFVFFLVCMFMICLWA